MLSNRRQQEAPSPSVRRNGAQHSIESMQLFELNASLWQYPTLYQSIQHYLERLTRIFGLDAALIFLTPEEEEPKLYAEVGVGSRYHHHVQLPPLLLEHILAAPQQILQFHPSGRLEGQAPALEKEVLFSATIPTPNEELPPDAVPTPAPSTAKHAAFVSPSLAQTDLQELVFGKLPQSFAVSLALAMRVSDSLEGVMVLARRQDQPLTPRELAMLRYLGQQTALAMTYRRRLSNTSKTENMLRDTQRLHHLILEATQDGVWGWDLRHQRLYLSSRWKRLLGYTEDSEIGDHPDNWTERIHPEDRDSFLQKLQSHINGETSHCEIEHRLQCHDGTYRWMLCRGIADRQDGQVHRLVGTLSDIHDQKRALEKLQHQALHDPLTGLPNRALFLDRLGQALKKRKRQKAYIFAVLFIDLDQFKQINDSFGHLVGDQLLRSVSHRLRSCLRNGDTIARLGGDEFVLLLDNLEDKHSVIEVARRVQATLQRPFLFHTNEVRVSSSIGIVVSADHYNHPEEFLQDADAAMYQAKAHGRNQYSVFENVENSQGSARIQLKKDLHAALLHEQLRLQYQPIVSLETGDLVGFEALVRWHHPERGLLLPNEFLPLSEETGLIIPISWWILQEACRQMKQWQSQYQSVPPLDIHVNLSSQALVHDELVEQVDRCLRETGLAPFSLHIELTEETLLNNTSAILSLCEDLSKRYVHFDLDDFGTGFSSISHLHRFPLHTIKIDRSFIKNLGHDQTTNNIIRTISLLANELGIDLVAEGVENEHQSKLLQQLHCPHAQGFLFAHPMSPATAETYLQQKYF